MISFFEINLDFSVATDNAFLTKIAPYNTKIGPERLKDAKDYVYTPSPHDKEIRAHKFGLLTGQRIDNQANERVVNQLVSLCACLKEKPFI